MQTTFLFTLSHHQICPVQTNTDSLKEWTRTSHLRLLYSIHRCIDMKISKNIKMITILLSSTLKLTIQSNIMERQRKVFSSSMDTHQKMKTTSNSTLFRRNFSIITRCSFWETYLVLKEQLQIFLMIKTNFARFVSQNKKTPLCFLADTCVSVLSVLRKCVKQ